MMVGLQKSFSWSSLATSVVAAGVNAEVSSGVNGEISSYNQSNEPGDLSIGPTAAKIISGTVGGFAGGVAASLTQGGKINVVHIAADAFGNALGGAIGAALAPDSRMTQDDFRRLEIQQGNADALVQQGIDQSDAMQRARFAAMDRESEGGYADKGDVGPMSPNVQTPGDDPTIPEVRNEDGSWTLPKGKAHPITALSGDEILAGRPMPVDFSTATINADDHTIQLDVRMAYRQPGFTDAAKKVDDSLFRKMANLADDGIETGWSREVHMNGDVWAVHVNVSEDDSGMPMILGGANHSSIFGDDFGSRSRNLYPFAAGTLFWDPRSASSMGQDYDGYFSRTAGHEFGHAPLYAAFGAEFSWGHEGTSTMKGDEYINNPEYPKTGEISLMPYFSGYIPNSMKDFNARSIASENDVKTLIYVSKRNTDSYESHMGNGAGN
jgi:hypothetical protein